MTDPRNPNAMSKQQNRLAIIDKIRAALTSELAEWSIDPDKVYVNGVNNEKEKLVIYCRPLTTLAWEHVYENDPMSESSENWDLFSVAYSYADEHRVNGPTMVQIAKAVNALVEELG
jgi:hypothetical protein